MIYTASAIPLLVVASSDCVRKVLVCMFPTAPPIEVIIQKEEVGAEVGLVRAPEFPCLRVTLNREQELYVRTLGATAQVIVSEETINA